MKLFYVFLNLTITYLCSADNDTPNHPSRESTQLMFMQHNLLRPNLASLFVTATATGSQHARISSFSVRRVKRLCIKATKNELIFRLTPTLLSEAERNPEGGFPNFGPEIENHFKTVERPVRITLPLTSSHIQTPAVECISGKIALADIFYEDRVYLLMRVHGHSYYDLIGKAEPIAVPDIITMFNKTNLERAFNNSLKAYLDNSVPLKDICSVGEINHLTACAAAYMYLYPSEATAYPMHSILAYSNHVCMKNNLVRVSTGLSPDFMNSGLGMFACSVNKDWLPPQFFIVNDQTQSDAIFVLLQRGMNNYPPGPVYELIMRLTKVNAFKHAFPKPITNTFLPMGFTRPFTYK